jgi:hypothetical protein
MKTKRVLCPERLRHVPQRFSWIDQRLVRDGHIARCGPQALALYLLLVTVADAQGLSAGVARSECAHRPITSR